MIIQFPGPQDRQENRMVKHNRDFLSSEEIAEWLGFSVRTVTLWAQQWHESGGQLGLPAFKMGRSWRFKRVEIEALIERRQAPFQTDARSAATA